MRWIQVEDVRLGNAVPVVLGEVRLIGVHGFGHVDRSHPRPPSQQNLGEATGAAATLEDIYSIEATPARLPDATARTVGAEALAGERVELGLTILQPLRAKGGGIGAGSNEARYVGDDGKLMTVLACQRPAGRLQRHAVIRAGPSG
jgi:hypothetical protein